MVLFYHGVAGRRPGKPKGVVIHNDAGSNHATPNWYGGWLPGRNAELGFAHVYQTASQRLQWENYEFGAWHVANYEGNLWYVGWEVCQSEGDYSQFLANEQAVLKDVANYMKSVGLPVNRSTVRLHHEFSATSCPRRSMEAHTGNGSGNYSAADTNKLKDYFIAEILKFQGQGSGGAAPSPSNPSTPSKPSGGYTVEKWNVTQVADVGLNIRASQNTSSAIVGGLSAGQQFLATRICREGQNVNGYTTWFEVNGRGWVSGAYVTPVGNPGGGTTPAPAKPSGGSYTFRNTTNVRDRAGLGGNVVATYQAGQTVYYDSTVQADGYTWMSYIGSSGKRRYVAMTN